MNTFGDPSIEAVVANPETLLFVYVALVAGIGTYYAWFRPQDFQRLLDAFARMYHGWMPMTERAMKSRLNLYALRILNTLGFLLAVCMLIYTCFRYFVGGSLGTR